MLSGRSGVVPKTDVNIATFLLNLAVACLHDNRHKGPNIAGTDPNTGELVRLFHPRTDPWNTHFEWKGAALTRRTAIGRAAIHVLSLYH